MSSIDIPPEGRFRKLQLRNRRFNEGSLGLSASLLAQIESVSE